MFPFTALTARATFSSWVYDVKSNPRSSHSRKKKFDFTFTLSFY